MIDAFDIYNNTTSDVVCANGTIPANGFLSISAVTAQAWAKDPIVQLSLWNSILGVSVYGTDFGYGFGSQGDVWIQRLADGNVQY